MDLSMHRKNNKWFVILDNISPELSLTNMFQLLHLQFPLFVFESLSETLLL
jgi:hypothetical protein